MLNPDNPLGALAAFLNLSVSVALQCTSLGTNAVLLAWPTNAFGYSLQQKANLASTNWLSVTNPVVTVNCDSEFQVIVAPLASNAFYRLVHVAP